MVRTPDCDAEYPGSSPWVGIFSYFISINSETIIPIKKLLEKFKMKIMSNIVSEKSAPDSQLNDFLSLSPQH